MEISVLDAVNKIQNVNEVYFELMNINMCGGLRVKVLDV